MKKIYLFSLMLLSMLSSCGGADKIEVSKDNVSFGIDGGENNVTVKADGSWDVTECPDWVTAEVHDSLIVVKVNRNDTGKMLKGDIILTGKENVTATIHVKQATKCTHITPESDKVEFDKEGGTKTVAVDTDGGDLNLQVPDGFTATFDDGTLTVNATANEAGTKRGEIKLTCEDQSATINVIQKGNLCQRCGGTGKITCPKCHGKGYTEVYDDPYYAFYGCKACGGGGYSYKAVDEGYHEGSGKIACPDCGGSGR